jgi:metal-dependent amidase/aminoacylase/carboxypeptidase family protein
MASPLWSRRRLTEGARRIIDAEAIASGAPRPPEYQVLSSFPVTVNDAGLTGRLAGVLASAVQTEPVMGSEDFGLFGTTAGVPSMFWGLGCPEEDAPGNHSPRFAPRIEPTLSAGVAALGADAPPGTGGLAMTAGPVRSADEHGEVPEFDPRKPRSARLHDYWPGGCFR